MQALVVDDSRVMRRLLHGILDGAGYTVREADGGPAALRLLAEGPRPDVLLVDWNMPEMTGIELVRAVRAEPAYAASRIVMVTTETSANRIGEALQAGADEYLMKPFVAEALLEKLRQLELPVAVRR